MKNKGIYLSPRDISDKRIFLSPPQLGDKEKIYLDDALESNWIAPLGPHVDDFENEISKK